jgi:hypothetical protein
MKAARVLNPDELMRKRVLEEAWRVLGVSPDK